MSRTAAPERWQVQAGPADVATLAIPPDLHRDRDFEIDCRFVVRVPADPGAATPWLQMRVLINGHQEWERRIDAASPGATDSLDLHVRRRVPPRQALKVVAQVRSQGVQRLTLQIEAEENP